MEKLNFEKFNVQIEQLKDVMNCTIDMDDPDITEIKELQETYLDNLEECRDLKNAVIDFKYYGLIDKETAFKILDKVISVEYELKLQYKELLNFYYSITEE